MPIGHSPYRTETTASVGHRQKVSIGHTTVPTGHRLQQLSDRDNSANRTQTTVPVGHRLQQLSDRDNSANGTQTTVPTGHRLQQLSDRDNSANRTQTTVPIGHNPLVQDNHKLLRTLELRVI